MTDKKISRVNGTMVHVPLDPSVNEVLGQQVLM